VCVCVCVPTDPNRSRGTQDIAVNARCAVVACRATAQDETLAQSGVRVSAISSQRDDVV
jgi:hypothetical protein